MTRSERIAKSTTARLNRRKLKEMLREKQERLYSRLRNKRRKSK